MKKETLTCASICAVKDDAENRSSPKRDLRLEVLELRRLLKQSEDVASRHTVMLREGDHRIKNSLQIVASLMTLQSNREESASARDALQGAAARVRSIALIHDALQATSGADCVDLGAVLQAMCESLQAMAGDDGEISVLVESESLHTPVVLAQPLALAVNELVVNALRHAFTDGRRGSVRVAVAAFEGSLCITVTDDGVGLPEGYAVGRGYGMKMVSMMTKQVSGTLHVENKEGATFTIRAPLNGLLRVGSSSASANLA